MFLSGVQARGSVIPTSWSLTTGVLNNQTQDFSFINTPPFLPFIATHTSTLGSSSSQASYAFQIGANFVDYLISVQQSCVQVAAEHTDCRNGGTIDFTPRNDVLVEIDGAYHYNMTTSTMTSGAGANLRRINPNPPSTILFGDGGSASTIFSPGSGTISLLASGTVPGGFNYRLDYSTRISYLSGQPTTSTANGYIHFRVTEVPEPSALGLLALGAVLPRRRRPCRAC